MRQGEGREDHLPARYGDPIFSPLETTSINLTKVVKAGSFAKFTILRRTRADPVDVVFYIAGKSVQNETFESLSETIHSLLIELYPSKSVEDFEIQRRRARHRKGLGHFS